MRLSEAVIDSTVWDEVEVLRGTGSDLAESLRRFVNASSPAEMPDLWDDLKGVAFTQNTLHDGAVPVVDVMLAVLADPSPPWLRAWAIEVLRVVVMGDSPTHPDLRAQCLERAAAGRWLLAAEANRSDNTDIRDAAVEVLDVIASVLGPDLNSSAKDLNVLVERVLESIDWSSYQVASGPADAVGAALHDLLTSTNLDDAAAAWNRIEEQVFSQCDIYSAAEPTITVMLAALTQDQPPWRSGRILDLLFYINNGTSTTDPTLRPRCHQRTREGLWLLTQWAITHTGWSRDNALEIIELIAPDHLNLIRLP